MESLEKTTHDWFRLDEIYYRKYLMSKFVEPLRKISFNYCHIAIAKNGGLMAFVKKSKTFLLENNLIKDHILVYYQNGHKEAEPIKFEDNKTIVLFEFTKDEDLICLVSDGKLYRFDIYSLKSDFDYVGLTFSENNIIDAKLFNNCMIMLTENGDFYINNNINESNSLQLLSIKKYIPDFIYLNYSSSLSTLNIKNNLSIELSNTDKFYPNDFLLIPSSNSLSGKLELIIPHPKQGIIIYEENSTVPKYLKKDIITNLTKQSGNDPYDKSCDLGCILKIILSSNNSYIALFNTEGLIFVMPSNLNTEEMSISETGLMFSFPFQMMWCSEDCIVSYNQGLIHLIGPDNKTYKITTRTNNAFIVQETDGIRVVEDDHVDFIQRVSKDLIDSIFPLSIDPSKKLLEVYKLIEDNKPSCDREIREIKQDLPEAVNKLLSAASSQWNIYNQIFLMKAAQHGKNFLTKDEFSFNNFFILSKDLRILNNLRLPDKPRLITYDQYKKIGIRTLVNNLIKMHNFYLAYEIYQYLGLNTKDIYEKWALAYIRNIPTITEPNEEKQHFYLIEKKISESQGISCIKLAKEAFKYKKDELGMLFLDKEKSLQTKIPQYIELQRWDKAIDLSVKTRESNIINVVLDKMLKSMSLEEFISQVSLNKHAYASVIDYLKYKHPEILESFLKSNSLYEELLFYHIENFYMSSVLKDRTYNLLKAKSILTELLKLNKDYWSFYITYLQDIENSLEFKASALSEGFLKCDINSFDKPLFDFFYELISNEKISFLELKNKQLFEISQKKINVLRVKIYAENKLDNAIKLFGANIKNQFANYLAFAEVCYDNKLYDEATAFLKKVSGEDYFDYKYLLLKNMEKYYEACEFVISDKECDRKEMYINELIVKDNNLKGRVFDLCSKYKVNLNL